MEQLVVYPITHRGEHRIALQYDHHVCDNLDRITRSLPERKFSATKKCWHIPYREDYRSYIRQKFQKPGGIKIRFNEDKPKNQTASSVKQQATVNRTVEVRIDKSKKKIYVAIIKTTR